MSLKTRYILALMLIALSVLSIFAYSYLPKRKLALVPSMNFPLYSSADSELGGKSTAQFLDASHWQCSLRESSNLPDFPYCRIGITLSQSEEDWTAGVDLSKFDAIRFKYRYRGPAKFIRAHFRNYDTSLSSPGDYNSAKFMQLLIREPEGDIDVSYLLTEFKLADWWIQMFSVPTHQAKIAFNRVTSMEIDFAEPVPYGEHFIELQSIELIGDYVPRDRWYLGILIFWLATIGLVVSVRLQQIITEKNKQGQILKEANERAQVFKKESLDSHNRSRYDPLTGVLNRLGFQEIIESAFDWRRDENQITLLVLDIDNFKSINDERGHDVGDKVLVTLGNLLQSTTREYDTVARWGGEEFVIICPRTPREAAQIIAEKLRTEIQNTPFFEDDSRQVTASIGLTIIATKEPFAEAFKRADSALFEAKKSGRNRWVLV